MTTPLLFVDDERHLRNLFSRTMSDRGYVIDLAENGHEAIQQAERNLYPVIVSDLRMPGMDGLSLIENLHQMQPDTSFVMVTAVPEVDLKIARADPFIQSILTKPWDPDEMARVLDHAVQIYDTRVSGNDSATQPNRVLLVEDSDADAELLRVDLEECNDHYQIKRARRLDEALRLLHDEQFSMILTDLSLPDARGIDTVTRLHTAAQDTPVIVISGMNNLELEHQTLHMGAQDFLVKGETDIPTLQRSLRHAVACKVAERRLSHLAHNDQLTGLANRSSFHERIKHAIVRSQRRDESFSVMFLDLDRFKTINDTLGHEAGDQLLIEVSERLRRSVRENDTVARLGGDEFAVLLEPPIARLGSEVVARNILDLLEQPVDIADTQVAVTSSIGIAHFPGNGVGVDELLKAADTAMYRAKASGRNNFKVSG